MHILKRALAVLMLLCAPAMAQTPDQLVGQWQGTLHVNRDLRAVIKIEKSEGGGLTATMYSIDQSPTGRSGPVLVEGGSIKMPVIGFEGGLSADAKTIKGTVTQGIVVPFELERATPATAWAIPSAEDKSAHAVQMVAVDKDAALEVLDWGGKGKPLIFLAGLGATGHAFDNFAPNFTGDFHVYAITRRGFGASSKPDPATASYAADRLGDDVLAVMTALKLERPILAGHSLAGEEISSIASRDPGRIAAAIYLEAAHAYAFYAPGNVNPLGINLIADANELRAKMLSLNAALPTPQADALLDDLLKTSLPQLEADVRATQAALNQMRKFAPPASPLPGGPQAAITSAITLGAQKYTKLNGPVLAIFAVPGASPPGVLPAMRDFLTLRDTMNEATAKRFAAANPSARVIRIANSRHDVFNSNSAEVVKAMKDFLAAIP